MTSISFLFAHAISTTLFYIVIQGALSFEDIDQALAFYGVYHQNPINQIIHFFGVPCIIWSLFVFLAHLQLPLVCGVGDGNGWKIDIPGAPLHNINYATCLCTGYAAFYIYLDLYGGLMFAPFEYLMYTTSVSFTMKDQAKFLEQMISSSAINPTRAARHKPKDSNEKIIIPWIGTGRSLKVAGLLHIIGWYVQIHPGHKIFEGATPAVMHSVGGALTSAPLFAFYEGLWFIGLNKNLQEVTLKLVSEYTRDLCEGGEVVMRACENFEKVMS